MEPLQQSYTTDKARWEAYQFCDPFATSSFLCCNKKEKVVCRPNCDALPKLTNKEDMIFETDVNACIDAGYKLCSHCDALDPNTQLDLALIKLTIDSINHSIGFTNDTDMKRRAFSVPSVANRRMSVVGGAPGSERQITKNESEHVKLVELACRHIASAASSYKKDEQESLKGSKRKRRGGVLGFKELASKSKLSPWHFHRVFKSITGLTPKSYGDQCWKFIKDRERPQLTSRRGHFKSNSEIVTSFKESPAKRKKMDKDGSVSRTLTVNTPPASNATISQQVSPLTQEDMNKYQSAESSKIEKQNVGVISHFDNAKTNNINSLDINVNFAPLRHQSLDMTNMMDVSDFNSGVLTHLSPPFFAGLNQLPPSYNTNSGTPSLTNNTPQQQLAQFIPIDPQAFLPSSLTPDSALSSTSTTHPRFVTDSTILSNDGPNSLHSFYTNNNPVLDSFPSFEPSLPQIDESQWPNVQASTPEELTTKLLTPTSSVSDSELTSKYKAINDDFSSAGYNNYTISDMNQNSGQLFYEVLRNSAWDDAEENEIQQNFGLISNESNEAMNNIDIY